MPDDQKKRETLALFRHKKNEKIIVIMRRQRVYIPQRRKELEASGFIMVGEAIRNVPNSRYTWMDFEKELKKSGALVRYTTPNLMKKGSNIDSLHISCDFDVQPTIKSLDLSQEEGDFLKNFLPFTGLRQRTLDEFMMSK